MIHKIICRMCNDKAGLRKGDDACEMSKRWRVRACGARDIDKGSFMSLSRHLWAHR